MTTDQFDINDLHTSMDQLWKISGELGEIRDNLENAVLQEKKRVTELDKKKTPAEIYTHWLRGKHKATTITSLLGKIQAVQFITKNLEEYSKQ